MTVRFEYLGNIAAHKKSRDRPSKIILSSNGLKSELPHPLEAMVEAGSPFPNFCKPKTCNRLTIFLPLWERHTTANESVAYLERTSEIPSRSSSGNDFGCESYTLSLPKYGSPSPHRTMADFERWGFCFLC